MNLYGHLSETDGAILGYYCIPERELGRDLAFHSVENLGRWRCAELCMADGDCQYYRHKDGFCITGMETAGINSYTGNNVLCRKKSEPRLEGSPMSLSSS